LLHKSRLRKYIFEKKQNRTNHLFSIDVLEFEVAFYLQHKNLGLL
jgi:hypothetical protein